MSNDTKLCKACKEEINKKAKRCPKCGAKQGMPGIIKALLILIIIFILISMATASTINTVGEAIDESIEEVENSYLDINGKTSFKVGETFENKYLKLKISDANTNFKDYWEYATIKSGHKILAIKIEAENIGEEDQYVSSIDFNCYADGNAVEEFYSFNDEYTELSATISSGKKASGYVFFEIPKNAKAITVEYDPSWLDSNNIEFVIK